jgi:hypothetical protein
MTVVSKNPAYTFIYIYLSKRGVVVEFCYKTHKNVPTEDPCM